MKKDDVFLYQLNINCKKYPDICKVLEEEKENNGIAFYLRGLIKKDIEQRNRTGFTVELPEPDLNKASSSIQNEKSSSSKKTESQALDESGGLI